VQSGRKAPGAADGRRRGAPRWASAARWRRGRGGSGRGVALIQGEEEGARVVGGGAGVMGAAWALSDSTATAPLSQWGTGDGGH
jgi:hypothetical protein